MSKHVHSLWTVLATASLLVACGKPSGASKELRDAEASCRETREAVACKKAAAFLYAEVRATMPDVGSACEGGKRDACAKVAAALLERGRGALKSDRLEARLAFEHACFRLGSGEGCRVMANAYRDGALSDAPDWGNASANWMRGCDNRDREACLSLAQLFIDGRDNPVAPDAAQEALENTCETEVDVCRSLITLLEKGVFKGREKHDVATYRRQGCEQGASDLCDTK